MQEEIWKDIPEYEGIYQVSNLGRVKSLKRTVKSPRGLMVRKEKVLNGINYGGYLTNILCKETNRKTIKIHQLVAIVFLNHKPNGLKVVVDHINNNKTDNRVENLQLITQRENASKDKKNKTSKYTGVSWSKKLCKWVSRIRINGKIKHLGYFTDEYEAFLVYKKALEVK